MACNCEECTCCWESSDTVTITGDGAIGGECLQANLNVEDDCGNGSQNLLRNLATCGSAGIGVCIDNLNSNVQVAPSPTNACAWTLNYGCENACACVNATDSATVSNNYSPAILLTDLNAVLTNDSACDWSVLELYTPQCQQVAASHPANAVANFSASFLPTRYENGAIDTVNTCPQVIEFTATHAAGGWVYEWPVGGHLYAKCHTLTPGASLAIRVTETFSASEGGVAGTNYTAFASGELTLFATNCG